MASSVFAPLVPLGTEPTIAPLPSQNQADAAGLRTGRELAAQVAEQHRRHLRARRHRDLTCEKYILHIDGEQWVDILHGSITEIPRTVTKYRETENLLRPIVDNAVAYHCTQPFRYAVSAGFDRRRRLKAQFDTVFANHIATTQRLNSLAAQAFYMATATGFCPTHAYWRDDMSSDPYEPLYLENAEMAALLAQLGLGDLRPGIIDCWVGNPFDHTFNEGAKRDSIQAQWYGRVLPADLVRKHFDHILAAQKVTLEGTDRVPSASVVQRILRRWMTAGTNVHGTAALTGTGGGGGEELITIVCREIAAGIDPKYPTGRLTIVALQGETSTLVDPRAGTGEAILLADQALPGGRFSSELTYSHHRFDDVHGKPWVADADRAQIALNIINSKEREYIERSINAPTIVGGEMADDMLQFDAYTILEMLPGVTIPPRTLEIPASPARLLKIKADALREYIFRVGGYQAASRGEGMAGDSAAKVVALASADDTVHGPINVVFRDTWQRFMGLCWRLFKDYGDVGWIVDAAGEEFGHLAGDYIDRTRLSDTEPQFRLVSGYGATPEAQGQQLLSLVGMRGADGEVILSTKAFQRRWPDQTLYFDVPDEKASQRIRAQAVAEEIRKAARLISEQNGYVAQGMSDPAAQQLGYQAFQQVAEQYPLLRDDDPNEHVSALSEITQDVTEDPVAIWAARFRQDWYYSWLESMAMSGMPLTPGDQAVGGQPPTGTPDILSARNQPGSSTTMNPAQIRATTRRLTRAATQGGIPAMAAR